MFHKAILGALVISAKVVGIASAIGAYLLQGITLGAVGLGFTWLNARAVKRVEAKVEQSRNETKDDIQKVHVMVNSANTELRTQLETANARLQEMTNTLATERRASAASTAAIQTAAATKPPEVQ